MAAETVRRQNGIALLATVVMLVVARVRRRAGRRPRDRARRAAAAPRRAGVRSTISPAPVPAAEASALPVLPSDGPRLGRADAKVTLEYWADYQCPFCAKFARDGHPAARARGSRTAPLALVHRDFAFLGAESIDAAVAVRCAGRAGQATGRCTTRCTRRSPARTRAPSRRARLAQIAASVGLDADGVRRLPGRARRRSSTSSTTRPPASGAGVVSTPTIDVNGTRFLGVPDVAKLLAAIDAAAAGASPAAAPHGSPVGGSVDRDRDRRPDGRRPRPRRSPSSCGWTTSRRTRPSSPNDLEPELRTRIATGAIRVVLRDLAVARRRVGGRGDDGPLRRGQAGPGLVRPRHPGRLGAGCRRRDLHAGRTCSGSRRGSGWTCAASTPASPIRRSRQRSTPRPPRARRWA